MEQIHKIKHDRIKSRKAVAPIIATLLMIAIAVVGGVMIYVFTQGFFGNSSISTSPSVDTITMTGYDMREVVPAGALGAATAGLTTHEGELIFYGDVSPTDGVKGTAATVEEGTIFIRNVGSEEYTISKIEVNGFQLTFSSTEPLAVGSYGVYTIADAADDVAGDVLHTTQTILPGEEGTILVTFDPAENPAAAGRTIPVKITSASGSVYNFNVVIGSKQ